MSLAFRQFLWTIVIVLCFAKVIYLAPTKTKEAGPCVGMNCLHGVLMHGDNKEGTEHEHEPDKPDNRVAGVKTIDEDMHGVLMHGDEAPGTDHSDDHAMEKKIDETVIKYEQKTKKDSVEKPEKLIHDANNDGAVEEKKKDSDEKSGNRLFSWFSNTISKLFSSSESDNAPNAHNMMDDLSLIGNSGAEEKTHNHPEKHPRMEKEKHMGKAHTEN